MQGMCQMSQVVSTPDVQGKGFGAWDNQGRLQETKPARYMGECECSEVTVLLRSQAGTHPGSQPRSDACLLPLFVPGIRDGCYRLAELPQPGTAGRYGHAKHLLIPAPPCLSAPLQTQVLSFLFSLQDLLGMCSPRMSAAASWL